MYPPSTLHATCTSCCAFPTKANKLHRCRCRCYCPMQFGKRPFGNHCHTIWCAADSAWSVWMGREHQERRIRRGAFGAVTAKGIVGRRIKMELPHTQSQLRTTRKAAAIADGLRVLSLYPSLSLTVSFFYSLFDVLYYTGHISFSVDVGEVKCSLKFISPCLQRNWNRSLYQLSH